MPCLDAKELPEYPYNKAIIYQTNWTFIGRRQWNAEDIRVGASIKVSIYSKDDLDTYLDWLNITNLIDPREDPEFKMRYGGGVIRYEQIWNQYNDPSELKKEVDVRYVVDLYNDKKDQEPSASYVSDGYYLYSPDRTKVRAVDQDFLMKFEFGSPYFRKDEFKEK